jgi:hypothetical protein
VSDRRDHARLGRGAVYVLRRREYTARVFLPQNRGADKLPIVRKPRFGDEFVYGDCAIAVALAVDGRNGLLRSFDRHYANRWLHVPRDVREMRVLQLAKYRR